MLRTKLLQHHPAAAVFIVKKKEENWFSVRLVLIGHGELFVTDSPMLLLVVVLLWLGACLWANISFNLFFVWYHPCSRCRLVCLSVLLTLVLLTILWPRFFLYQLPWTGLCYSYFFLELCGKSGVVAALVHNSFMAECVARVLLISRCLAKKEGVISGTAGGPGRKQDE